MAANVAVDFVARRVMTLRHGRQSTPGYLVRRSFLSFMLLLVSLPASAVGFPVGTQGDGGADSELVTIVVRYEDRRVVACRESTVRYTRGGRCVATYQWSNSRATLRFEPLADPKRALFGADHRKPLVVTLDHDSRAVTRELRIARGPWAVEWKEGSRVIRAHVDSTGSTLRLAAIRGQCRRDTGLCVLARQPVERSIAFHAPSVARDRG